MAPYSHFDSITEPRRAMPGSSIMHRTRTRRCRTVVLVLVLVSLLLLGWNSESKVLHLRPTYLLNAHMSQIPTTASYSEYSVVQKAPLPDAPELMGNTDVKTLGPSNPDYNHNGTLPDGFKKTNPSFHLLIPASDASPNLCKTLLSSFVLSYPPPTLINYGRSFQGTGWDKGSHAGKIRGVYDYLSNRKTLKDDDLVLIVDGYDVWFQLPPDIMIQRYHKAIKEANERLRTRHGMIFSEEPGKSVGRKMMQKYTQKVLFAADKICWPNPADDPACVAVPFSTLPKDLYGRETDRDTLAFRNRPRFLNSGTVIGPVADVRAVYEYAVHLVEEHDRGIIGDQFVFAEIFGEQEYQREVSRRSTQGVGGRWLDWISNAIGTSDSPLSTNQSVTNMTVVSGQRYEFAVGLDYESKIFQTMTHSAGDVEFLSYNNSLLLSELRTKHPLLWSRHSWLPPDINRANAPFSYSSPGNHSRDPKDGILLQLSSVLDITDDGPTWNEVPLATNVYVTSVPALIHVNGDKSLLSTWWSSMWFHPYARGLLRRYIRSTQGARAAYAAAAGGETWWDTRGGRGGVWTDQATWMGWGEICKKTEDEVFADGKGKWMKEEGSRKVVNSFGKVLQGEDDDEDD